MHYVRNCPFMEFLLITVRVCTSLPKGLRDLDLRGTGTALYGCVAALDGIAIRIQKPADRFGPRAFFTRKGFYALNVQAAVDASYRFSTMSVTTVGASHDSLAFATSKLGRELSSRGRIPGNFWITGDAAYSCTENLLTPFLKPNWSVQSKALGATRLTSSNPVIEFISSKHLE